MMTALDLCKMLDIAPATAEKALGNLQARGLVTGYTPGDLTAPLALTPASAPYIVGEPDAP
jgi:predicted ArsR family transcriptional regulator